MYVSLKLHRLLEALNLVVSIRKLTLRQKEESNAFRSNRALCSVAITFRNWPATDGVLALLDRSAVSESVTLARQSYSQFTHTGRFLDLS